MWLQSVSEDKSRMFLKVERYTPPLRFQIVVDKVLLHFRKGAIGKVFLFITVVKFFRIASQGWVSQNRAAA